jgi:hypothetical protein
VNGQHLPAGGRVLGTGTRVALIAIGAVLVRAGKRLEVPPAAERRPHREQRPL